MDDEQYRQTRDAIDLPPCVYGKALQYGYFVCRHARNITLGEREAVHCQQQPAHKNCKEYYALSLEKSGFVLGAKHLPAHLTFNNAMQVQIGGLQGVMRLVYPPEPDQPDHSVAPGHDIAPEHDIAACFTRLKMLTSEFAALNFSKIVPYIQKFSLRKRGTDRR